MTKRNIMGLTSALALATVVVSMSPGEANAAPARSSKNQPVIRSYPMVLTRMAPQPVIIPGTIGSSLFGYETRNSVAGPYAFGGTLPTLDQMNLQRWRLMGLVNQVVGPMSVVGYTSVAAPQVLSSRTHVMNGVPLTSTGTTVTVVNGAYRQYMDAMQAELRRQQHGRAQLARDESFSPM